MQGEVFGRMMGISWRPISASLRFTDGAVIGSKAFVNEAFTNARERFGARREDGARRMRGGCKPAAGWLWSLRDLRMRVRCHKLPSVCIEKKSGRHWQAVSRPRFHQAGTGS